MIKSRGELSSPILPSRLTSMKQLSRVLIHSILCGSTRGGTGVSICLAKSVMNRDFFLVVLLVQRYNISWAVCEALIWNSRSITIQCRFVVPSTVRFEEFAFVVRTYPTRRGPCDLNLLLGVRRLDATARLQIFAVLTLSVSFSMQQEEANIHFRKYGRVSNSEI